MSFEKKREVEEDVEGLVLQVEKWGTGRIRGPFGEGIRFCSHGSHRCINIG